MDGYNSAAVVFCIVEPVDAGAKARYVASVRRVVVNGEPRELTEGVTVGQLLQDLGLSPLQVAVERNRAIVPKSEYAQTQLCEGDRLEIVTFVGGG